MLTFDESQIIYFVSGYSSITTSFQYAGLDPDWVHSRPPTSARSKPADKSTQPTVKYPKPHSTAIPIRPSDLDDEMLVDDRPTPLNNKSSSCTKTVHINLPLPTSADREESSNSDVEIIERIGSVPRADEENMSEPVDVPMINIEERSDDEEDIYSHDEWNFALSSPVKKEGDDPQVSV